MSQSDQSQNNANNANNTLHINREKIVKDRIEQLKNIKEHALNKYTKEELVDMLIGQRNIIAQQSSQLVDLVDLANNIEKYSRNDEKQKKCKVTRQEYEMCKNEQEKNEDQLNVYKNAIKLQFVLFILFLLVLIWLIYHYFSKCTI